MSDGTKPNKPDKRRKYVPPRVTSTTAFEQLALMCGKASGAQCQFSGGLAS